MSEEQPRTIDYATPATPRKRRWFSPRLLTASLLITLFLQIDFSVMGYGVAKQLLADFHLKLPVSSQLFVDVADWWTDQYGWVFVWPLAVLIPVAVSGLRQPAAARQGEGRLRWLLTANIVFLALNVIVLLTFLAVYYLPTKTLLEGITAKPAAK